MIKLGIIGAGFIAGINTQAILEFDVQVKAIANRTVSRAESLLDTLDIKGAAVYSSYKKMIDNEDLDAVLINLSHNLHLECFVACAQRGLDIIIEKPLAMNYSECLMIQHAAQEHGVKACVCHTQRYSPQMATARHLLNTMDFGNIYHIDDAMSIYYYHSDRAQWMLSKDVSGNGPLINYGVHQFDRVYFLKGCLPSPKTLYAQLSYNIPEQECISGYSVTGSDNDCFTYNFSFSGYSGPVLGATDVFCENGVIRVMIGNCPTCGVAYSINNQPFKSAKLLYDSSEMYKMQFKAIVDYIEGKDSNEVGLEWASQMVKMIDYANQSEAKQTVIKEFI